MLKMSEIIAGFSFRVSGEKQLCPMRAFRCRVRSRADTIWERVVAMATPATPSFKTATKKRSRKTFRMQVAVRMRKGVLASPRARRIPVPLLYTTIKTIPMK